MPSSDDNQQMEYRLRHFSALCGGIVATIGGYFFGAWISGDMTWRGHQVITMKTNASLCLLACGLSLLLTAQPSSGSVAHRLAQALATVSLVVGGLTFLEIIFSSDYGIDQLIATEPPGGLGLLYPNRMGAPGAVTFTLGGISLLLLLHGSRRSVKIAQLLAAVIAVIALLGMLGYLFGAGMLYGAARYTVIAWQTAVANCILSAGLLAARPTEGVMAPVTSTNPGGAAIRRMIPYALALPVLFGWLRLQGEWHGLYEHVFGTAILVVALAASFVILVYRTGVRLGRSADALQRTQSLLLEAEKVSHTGAWEWDLVTNLWTFSDEWLRIHGVSRKTLSPEELLSIAHPNDRSAIAEAFEAVRRGEREYELQHRIIRQDISEVRTVRARGRFAKNLKGEVVRAYGSVQDISEQKQAEDEARIQKQLLESVVGNMPAGIFVARGDDLRIVLVNRQYEAFAAGKEMHGKTIEEVWPEIQPWFGDIMRKVAASGEPHHATDQPIMLTRSHGAPLEQRYFTWSTVRVPLPGSVGWGVLTTAWETTDRKRTEEELRQARDLLDAVLEGTDSHVAAVGTDLCFLSFNSSYREEVKRLYGREVTEGMHLEELFCELPEERDAVLGVWSRAVAGEQFGVEQEFGDPQRKRAYFEVRFSPMRDREGNIIGATQISTDISRRKQAEEALRESEAKFRAAFELAAVGMGRVGFHDARWIDVNPAFCRMLGYSAAFLRATPWPLITHSDDVDSDLIPFRRMAAGELESYTVEKRFIHHEGHHVWARLSLSLVRDREGRPDYEIAVIEDITERKLAEEERRQAKEELEVKVRDRTQELAQALEELRVEAAERFQAVEELRRNERMLLQQSRLAAMGEMLGNISHQWRQPLNVLGIILQDMGRRYDKGTFTREYLHASVGRGRELIAHMSQTIDDFRSFLDPQRTRLPFDVREKVEKAVSMVGESLKGVDVEVATEETSTIEGFRNEYAQAVMNILLNARDAIRERKIAAPRLMIRIFREGGRSVVTIADNAGGVPLAILDKIFDPYFTTKAPDKGSGIGLFMAKNIIEKSMGGRLTARNAGEGAVFTIEV